MQIDLKNLDQKQAYALMTQSIVPRPIAWVLSESGNGSYNLAPFSYFCAVYSNPPLVMFSVGWKDPETPKDTALNISERNEFVIHIPHRELLEEMNASSAVFEHGVSEVEELGLETATLDNFRVPRLKKARIALACTRYDIQQIGPGRQHMIFGQIQHAYIDDNIVTQKDGRLIIDPKALDPLTRLGPGLYSTLSDIVSLKMPG